MIMHAWHLVGPATPVMIPAFRPTPPPFSYIRYYTASRCDVAITGPIIVPDYDGHGFNRYMPKPFIDMYNSALLDLQVIMGPRPLDMC